MKKFDLSDFKTAPRHYPDGLGNARTTELKMPVGDIIWHHRADSREYVYHSLYSCVYRILSGGYTETVWWKDKEGIVQEETKEFIAPTIHVIKPVVFRRIVKVLPNTIEYVTTFGPDDLSNLNILIPDLKLILPMPYDSVYRKEMDDFMALNKHLD
jgi:hypothetical protein